MDMFTHQRKIRTHLVAKFYTFVGMEWSWSLVHMRKLSSVTKLKIRLINLVTNGTTPVKWILADGSITE